MTVHSLSWHVAGCKSDNVTNGCMWPPSYSILSNCYQTTLYFVDCVRCYLFMIWSLFNTEIPKIYFHNDKQWWKRFHVIMLSCTLRIHICGVIEDHVTPYMVRNYIIASVALDPCIDRTRYTDVTSKMPVLYVLVVKNDMNYINVWQQYH